MRPFLSLSFLVAVSIHCSSGKVAGGSTDGAEIYKEACARCHGGDGVPTKGMAARTGVRALTSPRVQTLMSDEDLRTQILKGSRSKTMPSFQGALSDEQLTAVIAHVRYLGRLANPDTPATAPTPTKPAPEPTPAPTPGPETMPTPDIPEP